MLFRSLPHKAGAKPMADLPTGWGQSQGGLISPQGGGKASRPTRERSPMGDAQPPPQPQGPERWALAPHCGPASWEGGWGHPATAARGRAVPISSRADGLPGNRVPWGVRKPAQATMAGRIALASHCRAASGWRAGLSRYRCPGGERLPQPGGREAPTRGHVGGALTLYPRPERRGGWHTSPGAS